MPRLFISYRREDSIAYAGRLADHLRRRFGVDHVFLDLDQISAGADFAHVLDDTLQRCEVVIALIGPKWIASANERGRRLDQEDDFVRLEIAAGLAQGKRVIPVLVGGAKMPIATDLPEPLAALARRQAHEVSDIRFAADVDALARKVQGRESLLTDFMRLARDVKFRRMRQATAVMVALVLFFLGWMRAFDYFNIDTRIETYTMALGDLFSTLHASRDIVLVTLDDGTIAKFGKPAGDTRWRDDYVELIDKLSDAGARAIVFDMFFEQPRPAGDAAFIAAIRNAVKKGTRVIVAAREMVDGKPKLIRELREAASGWGLTCMGKRLGYASRATLLALRPSAQAEPTATRGFERVASIGLAAALANPDIVPDTRRWQVTIGDAQNRLWSLPAEPIRESDTPCKLMMRDDRVVNLIVRLAPSDEWRRSTRHYRLEQLVGPHASPVGNAVKDRIVLVGLAVGGKDSVLVPRGWESEQRFGVELHADVINNLVSGVAVRSASSVLQFVVMLGMAVFGGLLHFLRAAARALWRNLLLLAAVCIYLLSAVVVYADSGLLLNSAYHLGALFVTYGVVGELIKRLAPEHDSPV